MSKPSASLQLTAPPGSDRLRDVSSTLDRYFQVSLFLLIVTGFASLASTGRLDPGSVLFVAAALVFRAYLLLNRREVKIPERWTNYLTLLYILIFGLDLLISGSYVNATIHLVLFSLVIKIFSVQRERDNVYLGVLAFLAVLGASVLTVDTVFLGIFWIFLLLAVNTFITMEIRRSLRSASLKGHLPEQARLAHRLNWSLSIICTLVVLAIVVGSAAIFFVLPRFSAGYLSSFSSHSDIVTGFSNQVNLGEIGRIKQSDSVVMHVQLDGAAVGEMKWRGVALNVFDGKTWSSPEGTPTVADSIAGRFVLHQAEAQRGNLPEAIDAPSQFRLLHYRVTMEPIGTNVIFLPPVPVELFGKFRSIGIDDSGSITNFDGSRMTDAYEGFSQLPRPSLDLMRAESGVYPPGIVNRYLQLNRATLDPRIGELARKITDGAATDYDKTAAIEQYLRTHYGYTLDLPSHQLADPLADFLFVRKRGHCEYFASSMAVMLRTLGIPSRVVNGFRGGEYNDITGSYIIRGRDAHSWVEVYLPSVGWIAFDPTPADPQATATHFNRMMLYLDAAQEFWREWIINYDFAHQRSLTISTVAKAQHSALDLRRWFRQIYRKLLGHAQQVSDSISGSPRSWIEFILIGIGAGVLLWNSFRIARYLRDYRLGRNPASRPQAAASLWYSRMLKAVARQGYRKATTKTPSEFARSISEAQLRQAVENFTEHYERARFGDSVADAEQLPQLYEEIESRD